MKLKNAQVENPRIKQYEDMISPISDPIIMILKSSDKFIGYYSNGQYFIDKGQCEGEKVSKDNPVLFWDYLPDFTFSKYRCNCKGKNNLNFTMKSHFIGTNICLLELVPDGYQPRTVDGELWEIPTDNGTITVSKKKLFKDMKYYTEHGYWVRPK